MIYEVTINAPAIHEVVTTSADSEEEAIERAVVSALTRWRDKAHVTVRRVPDAQVP
jgi:hypothetical protein